MRILRLGLCLLACSSLGLPAYPQSAPITLEACVERGLHGSRQLEILRLQMASASADVQRASAVYDTQLQLDGGWQESDIPPNFIPSSSGSEQGQLTGRILREFSTGTRVGVELDAQRSLYRGSGPDESPLYQTSGSLQLSQPLWNNAFGKSDRMRVAYTRSQAQVLAYEYDRAEQQVAARIEDAYWAAWVARKVAASQIAVLDRLRTLRETFKARVDDGLLDETVLLNVDASLAVGEVDLEVLEFDAKARDEQLKELIDLPPEEWDAARIDYSRTDATPADEPPSFFEAFSAALKNRRDIESLNQKEKSTERLIELRTAQDRGDVAISGSIGRGDSDVTSDESWDFDKTIWSVGISMNMSLGRSASRADLEQAFLAREQVRVEREILEREIALDTRSALRQLTSAGRLVAATRKALDLQARKLEAENRRFDSGLTDVQTVLDYQDDRDLAERDSLKAVGGYQRALVALRLVQDAVWREGGRP